MCGWCDVCWYLTLHLNLKEAWKTKNVAYSQTAEQAELYEKDLKTRCSGRANRCVRVTHLRGFVWHQNALAPGNGVFHILGVAVALHSDQVTGRSNLACTTKGRVVRLLKAILYYLLNQDHVFNIWHICLPSLNSRLSSWLGHRLTTSVTCSAFL